MNINDIKANEKKIDVEGVITEMSAPIIVNLKSGGSNQKVDAKLTDGTGTISLTLWGAELNNKTIGDRVKIENGYTTAYKGVTQLSIGKFGKLNVVANTPNPILTKPTLEERVGRLEAAVFK